MNDSRLIWLVAFCALFTAWLTVIVEPISAIEEPALSLPSDVVGESGQTVSVPVHFANGGHDIVSTAFSIDFDESCLAFDGADSDGDGVPDGLRFLAPAAFRGGASFDASDTDGEIDITIVDFSPPFATLPDQTLLEIDFTIICTPEPGATRTARVGFSTLPRPSFSDPNGQDVAGRSQDGLVTILGPSTATATATPTATATATATPTATPSTPSFTLYLPFVSRWVQSS